MKTAYQVNFTYVIAQEFARTWYFATERDFRIWILGNEHNYIIQSKQWADLPEWAEAMTYSLQ
jgi:hypothetical protein